MSNFEKNLDTLLNEMRPPGILPATEATRQSTHKRILKRISKVAIEVCVYQRIQR